MEARELRIGNYVYVSNFGECRISGLDKIDNTILPIVEDGEKEIKVNLSLIVGVPLTEDWLLSFGFEEDGQLFHNQIALYKNGIRGFNYNVNYFEHENLEEIKYVHQLQNLYYALTTQELNQLKK